MLNEVTVLHEIAMEYFKLKHVPMSVKVIDVICPTEVYYGKDMTEVYFKILKGLITNTDNYINLCKRDGGYLFKLNIDDSIVMLQVDVSLTKKGEKY